MVAPLPSAIGAAATFAAPPRAMTIAKPAPSAPRDQVLVAGDPPAAVDPPGHRPQRGRIRAGAGRRLGHGEAGADVAGGERAQVPLVLGGRADLVQQVHVALVRGGAVHRQRAEQAGAGLFEQHGDVVEREPAAAELLRQLRRPDVGRAGRLLQLAAQVVVDPVREGVLFARDDDRAMNSAIRRRHCSTSGATVNSKDMEQVYQNPGRAGSTLGQGVDRHPTRVADVRTRRGAAPDGQATKWA